VHSKFDKPCEQLGVRDYAPAPDCYAPAPIKVVRADVDVSALGKQLRHLSPDQMHVLGQLLTYAADLDAHGLRFGQPVYVNLGDGEYLTNYFRAYVIGCITHVGEKGPTTHIYLSSDLTFEQADKPEFRTLLRLMPDSFLKRSEFNAVKARLIAENLLEAPPRNGYRVPLAQWIRMEEKPEIPVHELDDYDPPTIDTAPSAWLDPFSVNELESFKRAEKGRKGKGLDAMHDPAAAEKRKQRAERRLNVKETVLSDGSVVQEVTFGAAEPEPEVAVAVVINFDLPEILR
jgi:hypothetical protein